MKKILTFLAVLTILVACQKESQKFELSQSGFCEAEVNLTNSKTIPLSEALETLENVLNEMGIRAEPATKSISAADVITLGASNLCTKVKSGDELILPDTLLYAVNFCDGGFSILSANTDLNEPVMCITENGSISLEQISQGLNFISSTYCDGETKSANNSEDDDEEICYDAGIEYVYSLLISSAVIDYYDGISMVDAGSIQTKESGTAPVDPLLKTKWTQGSPFNTYKDPVGCAVIAVGQIMAFNEKPAITKFSTVSASWADLKTVYPVSNYSSTGSSYASDQVARFAKELGNSSNCDVDASGGTTINKVKATLEKYGYDVTKRIGCASGDINKIDEQLRQRKKPIYMRGQRKDSSGQHGHAWVIDGLNGNMYHINWGWHGDADGYFSKGVFNTANRDSYDSTDPGNNSYTGANTRNYYHYFRFLLYK